MPCYDNRGEVADQYLREHHKEVEKLLEEILAEAPDMFEYEERYERLCEEYHRKLKALNG